MQCKVLTRIVSKKEILKTSQQGRIQKEGEERLNKNVQIHENIKRGGKKWRKKKIKKNLTSSSLAREITLSATSKSQLPVSRLRNYQLH